MLSLEVVKTATEALTVLFNTKKDHSDETCQFQICSKDSFEPVVPGEPLQIRGLLNMRRPDNRHVYNSVTPRIEQPVGSPWDSWVKSVPALKHLQELGLSIIPHSKYPTRMRVLVVIKNSEEIIPTLRAKIELLLGTTIEEATKRLPPEPHHAAQQPLSRPTPADRPRSNCLIL